MKNNYTVAFRRVVCDAATFLPSDVYNHSMRVMMYVMSNTDIPEELRDACIVTAIAHDLIEDSIVTFEDLSAMPAYIVDALSLLTKDKHVNYIKYIKNIVASRGKSYGDIAYWVKIADMKDHLAQKDTLTDKLRTKYMEALPYLLP
jgi:hypothetical protein